MFHCTIPLTKVIPVVTSMLKLLKNLINIIDLELTLVIHIIQINKIIMFIKIYLSINGYIITVIRHTNWVFVNLTFINGKMFVIREIVCNRKCEKYSYS